jgi:tetratricopeptide (TPR) repeat protein/TPR repeat protein
MWNLATKKHWQETPEKRSSAAADSTPKLYAHLSRSMREGSEAAPASTIAIGSEPTSSSDHIDRGNAHLEAGHLAWAIADYSRAIELDPQSAIACNNRGVALAVAGELGNAIADYDRSAAIDPNDAGIYCNRGDAYRELGDCERSIADYTRAVAIDPACAEAYCGRAAAHLSNNEIDSARADFDKAIELDPANPAAHLGRGRICAKRGDFEQAIASFTMAIEICPELASAYNERGHAFLGAEHFSHAAADYAKAMELDPAIAENLRAAELSLELRPNKPAQPLPRKSPKPDGLTVSYYDYLSKPNGFHVWLVPFDSRTFATRPARLEAALKGALDAYRKQQAQGILDALEAAEERDPLVDLFKGIAETAKSHIEDRAEHEARAEAYFRAAAKAGDEKAAAILATFLSAKMEGITQNIAQAREFAERAVRSNDAFAIRQTAVLALTGTLGPADPSRAADLMWTAAELGDPVANAMLAAFFNAGTGLEQDHAKAEQYLRRAADLGMTDAQNLLGDLLCRRYAKKLIDTPEQAVRYLERSLNSGNSVWAASRLAAFYGCEGRDYPWRNHQKAIDYIPRCAPYSNYGIHFSLGSIHRAHCDFVSSWAHYNVARRALTLSQTIAADLKPQPPIVALQGTSI